MSEITTREIRYIGQGDGGDYYEITCPKCSEKIQWAELAGGKSECSCGYNWYIDIKAVGWKDDEK